MMDLRKLKVKRFIGPQYTFAFAWKRFKAQQAQL